MSSEDLIWNLRKLMFVYDWSGWNGFLLPLLVPDALRLPAIPGETADQIFARLPPNAKGLFAFHIDLTDSSLWPPDRRLLCDRLRARKITTLNASVMNISKRRVQAICYQSELNITAATNHGDASELLIVKTNRNCGGKREARLTPEIRCLLGVQSEPFWDRADHGYLVMPRCQIPATVWSDPGLVVERYIENEEHLFYRVYFLGRRFAISEASEQALVKTIGRAERLRLLLFTRDLHNTTADSIPRDLQPAVQECLQFVAAASIEFGCLDMLRDAAGNFYVVDINSTPHWGRESEFRIIDYIRHGIATDLRSF